MFPETPALRPPRRRRAAETRTGNASSTANLARPLLSLELEHPYGVEASGERRQLDGHVGCPQFLDQRLQRLDILGSRIEVLLEPEVGRAEIGAKVRLIPKEQIEPRREQPQLQVLAQKVLLLGRQERRTVEALQFLTADLQCSERAGDVTGELKLLAREQQHLLDFGERPFIARRRELAIQRFERGLLRLRLGEPVFEQRDLRLRIAQIVLCNLQRLL